MRRILVRSGKDPFTVLTPEAALARNGNGVFGANIGNLLFQLSTFRTVSVPGTEAVSDSLLLEQGKTDAAYFERVNSEFSQYVVPLANAFRPGFVRPLRRLTAAIKNLTIPVAVLGIGAQLKPWQAVSDLPDEVDNAARDFVSAVLERSASIGVRGEVTKEYLQHLGFASDSIDVIGCPSLYLYGADLHVEKAGANLATESRIAMNVTPSATRSAGLIAQATAQHPNLVYIPQEHTDLAMMMWREERGQPKDARIPTHLQHPLFTENRMRSFVDALPWLEYLRGYDFAFGTRIHGNIAPLLAGVPAFVIAHDSRTEELARYHAIPHRKIADIDESTTVAELYEEADYTAFNERHGPAFNAFTRFLRRNNVQHVFDATHADGGAEFDARLSELAFPPPVEVGCAGDPAWQTAYDRLRWLRQGAETDRSRPVGAYEPPLAPDKFTKSTATPRTNTDLAAAVERLSADVATLRKELRRSRVWSDRLDRVTRWPRRLLRAVRPPR